MSVLLHLGKSLHQEAFGFEPYSHPWTYQLSYAFSHPALVPLFLCQILTECVTGPFRPLILVAPCWMKAPWLLTVLKMLENIPCLCSVVKDSSRIFQQAKCSKVLTSLHLTLCLLQRFVAQTIEFSS